VEDDGIVVIGLLAGIHRRVSIVSSHTVLIGHTSTTRRPVAISVAGPRFTRSTAIGPRPRRHRTVARRHATARLRTAVALIVGFWVVGPRRFRFGAVLVIWPRAFPRAGVPREIARVVIPWVVVPQVVEGWPVGWVGAVFDDGVDAGQQAGE